MTSLFGRNNKTPFQKKKKKKNGQQVALEEMQAS